MSHSRRCWLVFSFLFLTTALVTTTTVFAADPASETAFPRNLESYVDEGPSGIVAKVMSHARQEPFNVFATVIFFLAIVHTFMTSKFMILAHRWEHQHNERIKSGLADKHSVHYGAEIFHFLGEVEVVFGLWAIVLLSTIVLFYDWSTAVGYIVHQVNFTEPMFVVVIMILAATRPILKLSENMMEGIANILGGSLVAWWLTLLTVGPLLGSFITEPAAMTITALLLGRKFYALQPSGALKYATLGILFVNISVGGTLTHFAAPPVLMVAAPWEWSTVYMLTNFGWKAVIGILLANAVYFVAFRKELSSLQHQFALETLKEKIRKELVKRRDVEAAFEKIGPTVSEEMGFRRNLEEKTAEVLSRIKTTLKAEYLPSVTDKAEQPELIEEAFDKQFDQIRLSKTRQLLPGLLPEEERPPFHDPDWETREEAVPWWVTVVHVLLMVWTIVNAHYPALFVAGLLFFLGFSRVSAPFQNRIDLEPPLLVGFFLAGLVIHGGVQGWWIQPVLGNLNEIPLMLGATILTAFNDNAAITFLSTLVPDFTDSLKYAVVAGAVAGGGLTVIANAPNPAGLSILKPHFNNEVSPGKLVIAALLPTAIVWLCFLVL